MGISKCQAIGCEREAEWACVPENERRSDIAEIGVCRTHLIDIGLTYHKDAVKPAYWIVRPLATADGAWVRGKAVEEDGVRLR